MSIATGCDRIASINIMTTATLEKELKKEAEKVSKEMGIGKKELLERALILYLDSVKQQLSLFKELEAWERLSDDAFAKSGF